MSRYIGPRLRILRRIGKLRGFTKKKPFRRIFKGKGPFQGKVIPPGQHGMAKLFKSKSSDYLLRLKVKQRLRYNYGVTEKQLVNSMKKAKKLKKSTGQALLQMLEMRLDNIVFRLNMAPTIIAARQLVAHGHIQVNGKKVNIPSYMCRPKEVISVAMKKASLNLVNRNLHFYHENINFYRKRIENTLAFVCVRKKIAVDMLTALQLISNGKVFVNGTKIILPQYVCNSKDVLSLSKSQLPSKIRKK
nr:ribosomal protein S4 [Microspora sp. UTEX LB472]